MQDDESERMSRQVCDSSTSAAVDAHGGATLGRYASWSLALAGIMGGSVYSVIGVVVGVAGAWAWLSFALAGVVATASAVTVAELTVRCRTDGGAASYLHALGRPRAAAGVARLVAAAYAVTLGLYARTFAQLLQPVLTIGPVVSRVLAVVVVLLAAGLVLARLGAQTPSDVAGVWLKAAVLVAVAAAGLWKVQSVAIIHQGGGGLRAAVVGGAVCFVAVEGFQLLAYRHPDIASPERTLRWVLPSTVAAATVLFVAVTLGTVALIGARPLVRDHAGAFAAAGGAAFGRVGRTAIPAVAATATVAALYASLSAASSLPGRTGIRRKCSGSRSGDSRSVIALGVASVAVAAGLPLPTIVELASLLFLVVFVSVDMVGVVHLDRRRWVAALGALGAGSATAVLILRMALRQPALLAAAGAVVAAMAALGVRGEQRRSDGVP